MYKVDIGNWRIGKVETINTAYLFTLINSIGRRIQINLERNPIGVQYELWCWDNQPYHNSYQHNAPLPNAVPKRRMLDKAKLQTPEILMEQIKELVLFN